MEQAKALARELTAFVRSHPSCYHVVSGFSELLEKAGYRRLGEEERWTLQPGGKYYVVRNGSSVIAFRTPETWTGGFLMAAAHSDSPTFKIKENAEHISVGQYTQLNTEKYGGMLMATWFDRPLSVAGRVLVRENGGIVTKLVDVDRDLLVIPSMPPHLNRSANDGMKYMANIDTVPLLGDAADKGAFRKLVAEAAGVKEEDILGSDLFLYNRHCGTLLGAEEQYIHSPKLDDLECAFGCMKGLIESEGGESLPVCAIFDNEEVGSSTKQGASSTMLRDTLRRIVLALGGDEQTLMEKLAQSLLVSADNAHARHPNHPEYFDADNAPYVNQGVVVKYNANQRYATDGVSAALFRTVCEDAGVPLQVYANRSDLPGGSTLGSLADMYVPVNTVDIGLAQLAMHSVCETAGVRDLLWLKEAMSAYFGRTLKRCGDRYTL